MTELLLNAAETEALNQMLENALANLRMELAHTDHATFRQKIRTQQLLLETIQTRLANPRKRDSSASLRL
jgi:hypothetical protein